MHVTYGDGDKHAAKLKAGLKALGPDFCAFVCWWCNGTTTRDFGGCDVCGKGRFYGSALGLLQGNNQPAPESVVNQVLVAAERAECEWKGPCDQCTDPMDCGSWATCINRRGA